MVLEMRERLFSIYDNLSPKVAEDIIKQYLRFRGDDGRAKIFRLITIQTLI